LRVYNYPSEVEDGGYVWCWFDVQNIGDETGNPWMFLTEVDEYARPIPGKEIDRAYGSALAPGQTGVYSLGGYLDFQGRDYAELWVLVGVSSDINLYQHGLSFTVRRKVPPPPMPDWARLLGAASPLIIAGSIIAGSEVSKYALR